jgi:putative tryptophan/tyrosine transport system substrate-binding protein
MQYDQPRRHFIALLAGVAVWPPTAWAQQPEKPVIGFLSSFSANPRFAGAFKQGLKELGFVEGQNVLIEYRYAEGHYDRLPALADDLVHQRVTVIFATGSNAPAIAAKGKTSTIPIIFATGGGDPVKAGLVASINRPGGNVTGISIITTMLIPKRFDLLHKLVPHAKIIGVLVNPNYPDAELQLRELRETAAVSKQTIKIADAHSESDLDRAFAGLVQERVDALFTTNDPLFNSLRNQIVARAAKYAIPATYHLRDFCAAGGLMSYGADFADAYRQSGNYVARTLKGERPADLPVIQSAKFELVINLKTANALGLEIPPQLLALADEVID